MIWITLLPADIRHGRAIGAAWHRCRLEAGSAHRNNRPYDPVADRITTENAAVAELAAHLALGTQRWNCEPKAHLGTKEPDLDGFIDVRERRRAKDRLIIQFDDNPWWAYVSVNSEHSPTFCIEAWCLGRDAMQPQYIDDPAGGRAAYFVKVNDRAVMRHPLDLIELAKIRRPA